MVVIDHLLATNKKSVLGCEARHTLCIVIVAKRIVAP